jgi:hypothetical protein
MKSLIITAFASIVSLTTLPLLAQNSPQQTAPQTSQPSLTAAVQVPFDRDGRLWIITQEMEQQYIFFPKYPNLVDARLFQLPDSTIVLEITQLVNNAATESTRLVLAKEELNELRNNISDKLQQGAQQQAQNPFGQNPFGRNQFPQGSQNQGSIWGTNMRGQFNEQWLNNYEKIELGISAASLGILYGIGLDAALSSGSRFSFGVGTIGMPIAFAGGTIYATSQPWFSRPASMMLLNGMTMGALHGMAAYLSLVDEQNTDVRLILPAGLIGSIAESALTLRIPEMLNMNYAQTSMMTGLGASAMLTGAMASVASGAFGLDARGSLSPNSLRWMSLFSLVGSAGGYYLGYQNSQTQHLSGGDSFVFMDAMQLVSALPLSIGILQLNTANPVLPDLRVFAGSTIGAQALGYVLGNELIRNKDFTLRQGAMISEAASYGALAGLVPFLFSFNANSFFYAPILSSAGGLVGLGLAYFNLVRDADAQDKARRQTEGTQKFSLEHSDADTNNNLAERTDTWFAVFSRHSDVRVSPLGLLGVIKPELGLLGAAMPLVSIHTNLGAMEREHEQAQHDAIRRRKSEEYR